MPFVTNSMSVWSSFSLDGPPLALFSTLSNVDPKSPISALFGEIPGLQPLLFCHFFCEIFTPHSIVIIISFMMLTLYRITPKLQRAGGKYGMNCKV